MSSEVEDFHEDADDDVDDEEERDNSKGPALKKKDYFRWDLDGNGEVSDVRVKLLLEKAKLCYQQNLKGNARKLELQRFCNSHPVFGDSDEDAESGLRYPNLDVDAAEQKVIRPFLSASQCLSRWFEFSG